MWMINQINNILHPLEQFEVMTLCHYWVATCTYVCYHYTVLTNVFLVLLINLIILICFLEIFEYYTWEIKNVFYYILMECINLVKNILRNNLVMVRSPYFTMLFYLFMTIVISNLVGLLPYSFTITSSGVVTLFLAFIYFISLNFVGIYQRRWVLFRILLPDGVPLVITTLVIWIETVSYIAKVFSLSIRLFANMMSGHALLKILIGFAWILLSIGSIYTFLSFFVWILVSIIFCLEILIALLQGYVFTILVTLYMADVVVAD